MDDFLWFTGFIISITIGLGIALTHGFWTGVAVGYSITLLVDIRSSIERILRK